MTTVALPITKRGSWLGVRLTPRVTISRMCAPSVMPFFASVSSTACVSSVRVRPTSSAIEVAPSYRRSRWASRLMRRPCIRRSPSQMPSPRTKPLSKIDTRASSRGTKRTPNQDPRFVIGSATVVIVAEWKTPKPESRARGLSLFTSTFRTSGPDVFDLRLNSHSRLNLIQALIQAIHAGADEALMLDPRGFVASCNSTNFFIVRDGELWTSTGSWSFKGITQKNVIEAWRAAGGVARECDFTLAQVYSADEALVTATLGGRVHLR